MHEESADMFSISSLKLLNKCKILNLTVSPDTFRVIRKRVQKQKIPLAINCRLFSEISSEKHSLDSSTERVIILIYILNLIDYTPHDTLSVKYTRNLSMCMYVQYTYIAMSNVC